METIRINFTDFWKGFDKNDNFFTNLLKRHYNVIISNSPDFIFYSINGYDFLKYKCTRIFYTGENISPNFNQCDYALGFDRLTFEDRYFRLPLYYLYLEAMQLCLSNKKYSAEELNNRNFCNYIYSRKTPALQRTEFFHLLSEYKFVHSGGKHLNNIGYRVEKKLLFQQQFKFSIAFENSSTPGYTTEKIVEAKAAGTIPIYWGNPLVGHELNPAAFINCHNFKNMSEAVDFVIELDQNHSKFLEMLNKPLINPDNYQTTINHLISFLDNIIRKGMVNRKADSAIKRKEEDRFKTVAVVQQVKNFFLPDWLFRFLE